MNERRTIAQLLSVACVALRNCEVSGNDEWAIRWNVLLDSIETDWLPSGSGIDSGTEIDRKRTGARTLVLSADFHHMNGDGFYECWTSHVFHVHSEFDGLAMGRITGRDRNGTKDYLAECMLYALSRAVSWTESGIEEIPEETP